MAIPGSDSIRLTGGVPLRGTVHLSGSKNGSLPLLAATLLMEGECLLRHLPQVEDVVSMIELLRALGVEVEQPEPGTALIRSRGPLASQAPLELVKRMRASFWVAGPLLARLGRARVPLPGGCQIGTRPVDFHLAGFEALGANVQIEHGFMAAQAPSGLRGATIFQDSRFRSVGATINIAMAACLAKGRTVIENAAREPEVADLCEFLNRMGASITGVGSATLQIQGVDHLHGVEHTALSDRIEAGTFLLAGAITGGEVTVSPIAGEHLGFFLEKLAQAGVGISAGADWIRASCQTRPKAVEVSTGPFPLFPTDLQPPMTALLCLADGTSVMEETIYNSRLTYLDELARMGAEARIVDHTALIRGVAKLTGAAVRASDIRAGAALVLAALAAEGESVITGRHFIERGYQGIEHKLLGLGARVALPK